MAASKLIVASAILLAMSSAVTTQAQTQRSGGGANAQLMQQYQEAVTERSQLQADNQKLKKSVDDLKKQLDTAQQQLGTAKAGTSRTQAALAAAQTSNESNVKALADDKARMQELVGKFRETLTTLRGVETDRTQLQQQLAQSKAAYDKCAERNAELYQVDKEVLDRYQHQGMFSYMERSEPFTRLKKTQIDNLALEYQQRAEELRVKPAPGSGAVPHAAPSSTAVPRSDATSKPDAAATPNNP